MSKIVYIEEHQSHEICELICLKCYKRWIGTFPQSVLLKEIECPFCNEIGYVIKTGQSISETLD